MTITVERYQRALELLAKNDWTLSDNRYYIQLLNSDYGFDPAHEEISDVTDAIVSTPVLLTSRVISDDGLFTCDTFKPASAATDASYGVIYLQAGNVQTTTDRLVFCVEFNDSFDLATSDTVNLGSILTITEP